MNDACVMNASTFPFACKHVLAHFVHAKADENVEAAVLVTARAKWNEKNKNPVSLRQWRSKNRAVVKRNQHTK